MLNRHAKMLYIGTTAERTALALVLSATNYSVRYFDTDDDVEYYWNGVTWLLAGAREANLIVYKPASHDPAEYFAGSAAGLTAALVAAESGGKGSVLVPAGRYIGNYTVPDNIFMIGEYDGRGSLTEIYGQVSVGKAAGDIVGLQNLYIHHSDAHVYTVNAVYVTNATSITVYIVNCYLYAQNYNNPLGDGRAISIYGSNATIICRDTHFRAKAINDANAFCVSIDTIASNATVYLYNPVFEQGNVTNITPVTGDFRIVNGYNFDTVTGIDSVMNTETFQTAGQQKVIKTITANYTATLDDHTIKSATSVTITLPPLVTAYDSDTGVGLELVIKNIGNVTITIDANGAETIDGALTKVLNLKYNSITIQADAAEWSII